jgi:hypothetical protein
MIHGLVYQQQELPGLPFRSQPTVALLHVQISRQTVSRPSSFYETGQHLFYASPHRHEVVGSKKKDERRKNNQDWLVTISSCEVYRFIICNPGTTKFAVKFRLTDPVL